MQNTHGPMLPLKRTLTFAKYMSNDYVLIVVMTKPDKKSAFELTTKPQWVEMLR